jgi:hypothetical protein
VGASLVLVSRHHSERSQYFANVEIAVAGHKSHASATNELLPAEWRL